MAEIFGVAAGAAGFVSLLIQIVSGIDILRDIGNRADKAPAELESLLNELLFLERLMQQAIDKAPRNDDFVLQHCYVSCDQVVRGLEKLKKRFPTVPGSLGKHKLRKIFTFRHWKEDVEGLERSIQGAKINLILVNTCGISNCREEISLVNLIHTSSSPVLSPEDNNLATPQAAPTSPKNSSNTSRVASQAIACFESPKSKSGWDCAARHCSCSCHLVARISRRFWAINYTPLNAFHQSCDNKACNTRKYGGTFTLALSQLGLRWSAVIQLHILSAPGKLFLRPGFELERIVPYTSPGFEVLWKCENSIITVEVARDELIGIYRSDPTFKNHVNPGGKSYIEELVRTPWLKGRSEQHPLLELFMRDFRMTRGTQNKRFLPQCAKWIGEGPHLELLDILLSLGFDATAIDSPHALDWPEPSSPGWIAEDITPDPFFVEYQSMLLRDNQGFAKMTPLHEAVLFGSLESVSHWISRSDKDERNFLGQTPIHLAISNPKHLPALVQSGHDLDAVDNYGITPLMYAAATNQEQCLLKLLNAGANTSLLDTRYQRNFLHYAALRGHWSLILKTICWIEAAAEKDVAESWAQLATILFQVVYPDYIADRSVSFHQLLAKCGSSNFTFNGRDNKVQNNSLLHYARSVNDVETLLNHGFTLINHVNSAGQHALMTAVRSVPWPGVVRRLLDAGADIHLRDNLRHTTLFYILDGLQTAYRDDIWSAMDNLRSLLDNATDGLSRDDCRCPCSPGGCLPSAILEHSVWKDFLGTVHVPVWSLEWLSIISEQLGASEAKIVLLSFIRKAKFDEFGMTHVCCRRDTDRYTRRFFQKHPIPDEDVIEILEEEDEFVEMLEYEMAQSSSQNYETLLDDWILRMQVSLEKFRETAVENNEKFAHKKSHLEPTYGVDYKNDCFIKDVGLNLDRYPIAEVKSNIVDYIFWLEHEYHYGSTSHLEKLPRANWYFNRISWLHRLLNVLVKISTTEIAYRMRNISITTTANEYGPLNIEESIDHFLSSWDS